MKSASMLTPNTFRCRYTIIIFPWELNYTINHDAEAQTYGNIMKKCSPEHVFYVTNFLQEQEGSFDKLHNVNKERGNYDKLLKLNKEREGKYDKLQKLNSHSYGRGRHIEKFVLVWFPFTSWCCDEVYWYDTISNLLNLTPPTLG